jgi:HSP20 family protein
MLKDKKTFFERLAGSITVEDENEDEELDIINEDDDYEDEEEEEIPVKKSRREEPTSKRKPMLVEELEDDMDDTEEEGELSVDVYQTNTDIFIEAMVAGVKPEDLHLSITRDMVTIKGRREGNNQVVEDDYFYRELYWGNFTRTILLPSEIDIENAEAVEKHGLLIIRMPKLDKSRLTKLKVKSI